MPLTSILLRNWPQFAKIFLLIVLVMIFSFGWVWFREIPNLQNDLISERTHATQYPIQMAVSILDLYRSRAALGEMPLAEAQRQALRTLQETRYANNQYFWVHDLSLTMRMHPYSPELIGKSLAGYRDARGRNVFSEINRMLQGSMEGVVTYFWPRPGTDIPEEKMSCFRLYEPWGWVIGSGIYLDDVHNDIAAIKKRVITSIVSAFICAALLSLYLIRRINQPLKQTIEFARRVSCGEPIDAIVVRPETEGGRVVTVIKSLMTDLQAAYQRHDTLENERRQLEAQLIQAQKMEAIGKLAGGVAHEFNNILQVVFGYVMLLKEETTNPEHQTYLATVEGAIQRAGRLTQGMLAYSRQQIFKLIDCDVDETIFNVLPLLEHTQGEDIRLTVTKAPESIICQMDPFQIQQVLINLVTNARDAIHDRGEILISTGVVNLDQAFVKQHTMARTGRFAVISVADNGTGVDEAIREKIFEPFYTTKEVGKGTGLGLSIAYGIVSQHNGFMTCDSTVGRGTVFAVYLPVTNGGKPLRFQGNGGEARMPGGNGTILVAEDNEEVREIIRRLLKKHGYTVLCASDGDEAVTLYMAYKASIDLLLFDVMMPNKNGKQALDEIRAVTPSVPVCWISGYAREALEAEVHLGSTEPFISKPVDQRLLLGLLVELLHPA